jgi:hypothetical protein
VEIKTIVLGLIAGLIGSVGYGNKTKQLRVSKLRGTKSIDDNYCSNIKNIKKK